MHKDMRRSKAWESTIRKAHLQFRGCTIFSAMSVLPYDDADRPSTNPPSPPAPLELHHVERLLPNGDFYMGIASHDDRPHGPGKYLWTDGCMYEGEWILGKATGKGRFSWPSGATYEGEFKSWLVEGSGTFTGASGDTYRGSFSMNLKHGHGRRTYPNGDYYDGEWRKGVQEGHGKYVWKNGHEYNGSWKAGNMSGKGVLFWANGHSYDGEWDDGVPSGKGQFRWPDGAVFVGIWCKDQRSQKGTNLISAAPENVRGEPEEELEVGLGECKVCSGETMSVFPSQKATHWTLNGSEKTVSRKPERSDLGMLSRLRRSSVDALQAVRRGSTGSGERGADRSRIWESDGDITCNVEDGNVMSGTEPVTPEARRSQPLKRRPGEVKRQGDTISKGHKNYELMLNLQLGIRHSVGRPAPATSLDIKASAFDPKEKVWTRFPPEGSKHTPPHQSCDFRWKDYCPVVFRTLRKLFKVDPADYMLSLCGNDALRELSSPGKSGSFFYLSHDDRYMIKTVKKTEVKVLLRMLPAYYNHVRSFENSLVTKFFGLHCVKLTGATQKKVRFVIMGNLFCTDYPIHRRFDLKGSSHGRTTDKPESEIDETTTLKDLDLNFIFRLPKSWFQEFVRQVERDSAFLEQEKIMDYSLLVGLHFRETASANEAEDRCLSRNFSNGPRLHRGDTVEPQSISIKQSVPVKLGISLPCQVETVRRISSDAQSTAEPTGETYNVILFFGIIDILQDYDISKKLEHAYKSMQYDPSSISAVDPKQYSKRFRDFMFHVFTEDS